MGRRHVSAAGRRVKESPTAAGTGTQATRGQQEHQRAGDRTSRDRAYGGCSRRSGSPRPEACTAGCSGRVSRGTRTRRWHHRRWPSLETTGQGRAAEESERRRRAPRTEHSASRSATRQPRTQRGDHSHKISLPSHQTPRSPSESRGAALPLPLPPPPPPPQSRRARQQLPPPTPRRCRPGAGTGRDDHGVAAAARSGSSTPGGGGGG